MVSYFQDEDLFHGFDWFRAERRRQPLHSNDERPRVNHGMLECGLMDYIKAVGCISPYVDGRIQDLAPGKGTGSTSLEGQWVLGLEQ